MRRLAPAVPHSNPFSLARGQNAKKIPPTDRDEVTPGYKGRQMGIENPPSSIRNHPESP